MGTYLQKISQSLSLSLKPYNKTPGNDGLSKKRYENMKDKEDVFINFLKQAKWKTAWVYHKDKLL